MPTAHQEQFGVQHLAQHAAQLSPEPGFEPATLQSLVDLLYPLSYRHIYSSYLFHRRNLSVQRVLHPSDHLTKKQIQRPKLILLKHLHFPQHDVDHSSVMCSMNIL